MIQSNVFLAGIVTNTGLFIVYIFMYFYIFIRHFC